MRIAYQLHTWAMGEHIKRHCYFNSMSKTVTGIHEEFHLRDNIHFLTIHVRLSASAKELQAQYIHAITLFMRWTMNLEQA
jgi:hypothetical protein